MFDNDTIAITRHKGCKSVNVIPKEDGVFTLVIDRPVKVMVKLK